MLGIGNIGKLGKLGQSANKATADTTMLMFAESTECFHIAAGEKIAVLGGIAYITIME